MDSGIVYRLISSRRRRGNRGSSVAQKTIQKNRPGQRARQMKWEQKYGSNAKHLKKQQLHPSWEARKNQKVASFQGKKVVFDETMAPLETDHPSWIAKRKQKELQAQIMHQSAKPTKIVFN